MQAKDIPLLPGFLSSLFSVAHCLAPAPHYSLHGFLDTRKIFCLLTRGVILFGIESAPLSEDDDKVTTLWRCTNTFIIIIIITLADIALFDAFKAPLDNFWQHQLVKFDFTADLTGTGNRSEEVIKLYCLFMIVYNDDADLKVSDTCVRNSLLS